MPTHHACWFHLVWFTSNRDAVFDEDRSKALSRYMTNFAKSRRIAMRINFVNPDHVHALVEVAPTMSADGAVKLLKGSSASWINKSDVIEGQFAWDRDYAALTVSPQSVKGVARFIAMQRAYHVKVSLDAELQTIIPGWKAEPVLIG